MRNIPPMTHSCLMNLSACSLNVSPALRGGKNKAGDSLNNKNCIDLSSTRYESPPRNAVNETLPHNTQLSKRKAESC